MTVSKQQVATEITNALHDGLYTLADEGVITTETDLDTVARRLALQVRGALALVHLRPECTACWLDSDDRADFSSCAEPCWSGPVV